MIKCYLVKKITLTKMSNKKGFTLIELLIVIVIIGILSVAIGPKLMNYPKKARDVQGKSNVAAIASAIDILATTAPPATIAGCVAANSPAGLSTILSQIPKNPNKGLASAMFGSSCEYYVSLVSDIGTSGDKISYVVSTTMELTENGNIDCSAAAAPNTHDLIKGLTTGATGGCYMVKNAL